MSLRICYHPGYGVIGKQTVTVQQQFQVNGLSDILPVGSELANLFSKVQPG